MSDSSLYSDYIMTRQRVDMLERVEKNVTYLTLRRTTTQTIATTGTIISWEDAVRNAGFTWSAGTSITIPQTGFYALDVAFTFVGASVTVASIVVNGVTVGTMNNYYGTGPLNRAGAMRFFTTGDTVEVLLTNVTSRVMTVNAYGVAGESPFLHIVRVA